MGVRSTDRAAALYTRSGKQHRVDGTPVISTCILVDFGRATKFARHDDEGFVQEARGRHVVQKRGHASIQRRKEVFLQIDEIPTVGIPRAVFSQVNLDERDSCCN